MEYKQAIEKKQIGDWVAVGAICGLDPAYAAKISRRPRSKKFKAVMNALVSVVNARESAIANAREVLTKQ